MRGAAEYVKAKFTQPVVAAEVGVERGHNALDMLEHMEFKKLYLIDHYLPYADYLGGLCPQEVQDWVYAEMFNRLQAFLDKIVLVTRTSKLASALFPDEFFDFVYIDGNHDYDKVKEDMSLWFPKVKVGGVMGGHDFDTRGVTRQDVAEAVKDFADENTLQYKVFTGDQQPQFSDWVIEK